MMSVINMILSMSKQKDQPLPQGWPIKKRCSSCLLSRVKTKLRVPEIQRATFLNKIVAVSTVFL